ncbi:uncharacterized protein [Triticum aestivum]|uniref:uncharacterized protein isoform X2 n=1 Tax=Triticum aestivum TaxID=4565 RepID=UPI001D01BA15|nr:uncharacterized protein LOC123136426 isoform X2 [Triticum aestivum]
MKRVGRPDACLLLWKSPSNFRRRLDGGPDACLLLWKSPSNFRRRLDGRPDACLLLWKSPSNFCRRLDGRPDACLLLWKSPSNFRRRLGGRPDACLPRREERERETALLETSSSSMPQATRHEERERETTLEETSSSSTQTTRFKVPDLLSLKLDINLLADSCISTLFPTGLVIKYFVRVDNDGIFHTYPDRGGPFESIKEVQEAIDSHHAVQRKNICMDGLTDEERAIRCALYWYHNGTRKHSKEAFDYCTTGLQELVKAVLDKYNEDNGLVGDLAYELENIVSHKSCFDGKDCIYRSYDHFNLTMKTKGAANKDLYFAEVTCMDGDYEAYVLTCICMVKPDDNGECHVCGADMKHPAHDGYNRGRPFISYRHGRRRARGVPLFEKLFAVRDEAWLKEEEARVRRMITEGKEERRKFHTG